MNAIIPEAHKRFGVSYAVTDDRARAPGDRRDASSVRDRADRCGARRAGGRVPGDDGPPARCHRGAARRVAVDARGLHPRPRDARRFGHVSHRPEHLPDEARSRQPRGLRLDLDRQIARALGPVSMRMRLQNVTAFMAEALGPALDSAPGAPLHLVNIAGGPAIDSLNALILVRQDWPSALSRPANPHPRVQSGHTRARRSAARTRRR